MNVLLPKAGTYVVAVSGGVDSVVLLDLLSKGTDLKLIVAHFDHGIRDESAEDRGFVQALANRLGLGFEYAEGKLGPNASEATARTARYKFLQELMKKHKATAIVTAHHQDDVLETAILNMLRGTGRKGLTSLKDTDGIKRPLLNATKSETIDYANRYGLEWREDSTNSDDNYLRNYVRHKILPRFKPADKKKLLDMLTDMQDTNRELDTVLAAVVGQPGEGLDRKLFNNLPHNVAREVMAGWLRANEVRNFDRGTIERLVVAAKTASKGKKFPVIGGAFIEVNSGILALKGVER